MRKIIILWFLCGLNTTNAQNTNTWFRMAIGHRFKSSFSAEVELHHRRQQGFHNDNPLQENLLYAIRPWLNYKLNPISVLQFSPLAYYESYRSIQSDKDKLKPPQNELRSSLGYSYEHKFSERFAVNGRAMFEYRSFLKSGNWFRQRSRLGVKYQFYETFSILVQEEIMLNLNEFSEKHLYDQNRISFGLQKKHKSQTYEVGYIHVERLPIKSSAAVVDHNFYMNLTFYL